MSYNMSLPNALSNVSRWEKFTLQYTDLQTAGLTKTIIIATFPAKTVIQGCIVKPTTQFTGIASVAATVGVAGNLTKYCISTSLTSAISDPGTALPSAALNFGPESMTTSFPINFYATALISNLVNLTAGSVDIYLLASILP